MVKLTGTLVLVGAGKMGGAMLEGWLAGGLDPRNISVIEAAGALGGGGQEDRQFRAPLRC